MAGFVQPRQGEAGKLEQIARAIHGGRAVVDADEKRRELKALGFSKDQIQQYLQGHETGEAVEVLRCNWDAVQVYMRCHWTVLVDSGAAAYVGIASTEIEICARALGIALDADLLDGVRIMAGAAATILNKRD